MCRSSHSRRRPYRDELFAVRRVSREEVGPIRAGDADRERAAEALRTHAGEGRLDPEELERRLEAVYSAVYLGELDAALTELPRLHAAARPERPWRAPTGVLLSRAIALLVAIMTLLVVAVITGLWALWWLVWVVAMMLHPRGSCRRRSRPAPG
jgi:Domain of unknown function (DUF1707)